jgi:hypothetical protein
MSPRGDLSPGGRSALDCPRRSAKEGSVAAEKWMQSARESIERRGTEGVCTGKKFGSESCRPGTRRYALAKTFKKVAHRHKGKSR